MKEKVLEVLEKEIGWLSPLREWLKKEMGDFSEKS
jgi:hypothetical protein